MTQLSTPAIAAVVALTIALATAGAGAVGWLEPLIGVWIAAACAATAAATTLRVQPAAAVPPPFSDSLPAAPPAPVSLAAERDAAVETMQQALRLLRDGALTQRCAGPGAEAGNEALAAVQSALDEALALADLLAAGDLSVSESDAHKGQYDALLSAMGKVAGGLRAMLGAITDAADDIERQSTTLQGDAQTLSGELTAQNEALTGVQEASAALTRAITTVSHNADAGEAAAARAAEAARAGRQEAAEAHDAIKTVVARSREIGKLLNATSTIAQQTKLLGVNAAVEAARTGEAGRGFAVVAAEIQALAQRAREVSAEIEQQLAENDSAVEACAAVVQRGADTLTRIVDDVESVSAASGDIRTACATQTEALSATTSRIAEAETAARAAARVAENNRSVVAALDAAATGLRARLDGVLLDDDSMAEAVIARAGEVRALFEDGVRRGAISMADLFSTDYTLIEGTDPAQYMTPFVPFTDRVLPPVLESVFSLGDGVTFSAPVNRDGFLPTHNRKFSQPQGRDAVANAAQSRNRRFFNDRVGLAAGQSTKPFLIQAYRRDMGGGAFATMKDISAPIMVQGRHWGGLRIGYRAETTQLGAAARAA